MSLFGLGGGSGAPSSGGQMNMQAITAATVELEMITDIYNKIVKYAICRAAVPMDL